jgi:hypothetical protein
VTDDDEVTVAKSSRAERAMNATDSRIGTRLPPTVAWKNGGSGPMICDRAAP